MENKKPLNWTEFVDSRYLSGYDIEKPIKVTLERVEVEKVMTPKTRKEEDKIILYWKGAKKGQILTKRVARKFTVINDMKKDAYTWIGTTVELYTVIEKHFGEMHPILNIRPVR